MKIKRKQMDAQIRVQGELLRAISPLGSEKIQRILSPVSGRALSLLSLKHLHCKKISIMRKNGSAMRICVFDSQVKNGSKVGILWLHGGGYSLGAPEMAAMSFPRHLLKNFNCVIVSPDYTLSAKSEYPASFNDACLALEWMLEHNQLLGFAGEKIVVGGESAGGGLAAALAIYARDQGKNCFGFQIPLYPMLDDRVTRTSADNDAPVWNTKSNKSAWKIYLGDRVMNLSVPVYAAPARETSFSNIPPVISAVGTIDPFYAEDIMFFGNIEKSGAEVKCFVAEGGFHAYDMLAPYAKISRSTVEFMLDAYKEYTEKYL